MEVSDVSLIIIISTYAMHVCDELGPKKMWAATITAGQQTVVQRTRGLRKSMAREAPLGGDGFVEGC